MAGPQWQVVGGADKGGIVVRAERELSSPQLPGKLSTGALVEELSRVGERLHYRLLTGTGPEEGWVSIRLKDKVLVEPRTVAAPAAAAEPRSGQAAAVPVDDFATRLAALRERYPGSDGPEIPEAARRWSPKDLEAFVASGGFIKPGGFASSKKPAPAAKPPDKRKPAGSDGAPDVPQFSVAEAERLQIELKEGFQDRGFQERLLKLQNQHPNRKRRSHPDGPQFFEVFETLAMTVYSKVLPRHKLTPDWDGVRDMYAKMATALMHPKVKRQHEELNTLLGLPRDAVLRPSKKAEEVFVYRPEMDGNTPGFPLPTLEDDEGDEAHEFLVEDVHTGELMSLLESTNAWYRVVHRPHVTVRAKPDARANPVGTKLYGAKLRVQRVVNSKWLMLHEAELKKLSVPEAWVLCDGREMGLGEMLQRLPS